MSALLTGLVVAALFGFDVSDARFSDARSFDAPPSAGEWSVLGGPPGEACRTGAGLCREAYEKLEKCELSKPESPQTCAELRAEADARCRDTTSACDTDGSRLPPGR